MCVYIYIYIYIVLIEKKVDISHISHTTQHICNLQKLFNQKKKRKRKKKPYNGNWRTTATRYILCWMYVFFPLEWIHTAVEFTQRGYIYIYIWNYDIIHIEQEEVEKKKSKNKKLRKFHYPLIPLNIYFSLPLPLFSHWPTDLKNELCTINLKYFFKEQYSQNLKNN